MVVRKYDFLIQHHVLVAQLFLHIPMPVINHSTLSFSEVSHADTTLERMFMFLHIFIKDGVDSFEEVKLVSSPYSTVFQPDGVEVAASYH